jgi:hypothetical protein
VPLDTVQPAGWLVSDSTTWLYDSREAKKSRGGGNGDLWLVAHLSFNWERIHNTSSRQEEHKALSSNDISCRYRSSLDLSSLGGLRTWKHASLVRARRVCFFVEGMGNVDLVISEIAERIWEEQEWNASKG